VRSNTEADVIAALEATQPYDWRRFVDERVRGLATPTPTRAFEAAGWRLAYADTVSGYESAVLATAEFKNLRPSLGMRLDNTGLVTDVVPDRPAAKAGVAPGMRLLGVDGRKYTYKRLEDAIKRAKTSGKPIELLVDDGDFYQVVRVDHRAGMRFVALERAPGAPDHLGAILAPHAAREANGR
jgi:predicted metalloprotease with PDZ domain